MKIICFSATASFGAGIALLAVGAITVRRTHDPAELPYSAIPLLFGAQQLVEGGLWLALPAQTSTTHVLATIYLLFSHVLWPIYLPLAVWTIETSSAHRRKIDWTVAAGAAVSLFFLIAIIAHPVSAAIKGMHIKYRIPHPHDEIAVMIYIAATCLAPLLSSHRMVRLFGIVLVPSMMAAYALYAKWFASTWCFFAAVTSSIVLLYFLRRTTPLDRSSLGPA